MRQVVGLLKIINRSELIGFYNSILSYKSALTTKELPSLSEFIDLSLNKSAAPVSSFDEETDKFLEAEALKRLEERRKEHGQ